MRTALSISLASLVCIWSVGALLIAYLAEAASERPEDEAGAQFLQGAAGIGLLLAIALVVGIVRAAPRLWLLPLAAGHVAVFLFTLAWVETAPDFGQRIPPPLVAVGALAELLALLAVLLTPSRPREVAL